MRINRSTSLMLSAAMALTVAAPAAANRPQEAKDDSKSLTYRDCSVAEGDSGDYTSDKPDENYISFNGDDVLWPPNHREVVSTVEAQDRAGGSDESQGTVALMTTATHDEYDEDTGEELNGSGNTPGESDATVANADVEEQDGDAETDVTVRAERSGRSDGRTYTINATARFDDEPENCDATFLIEVPHDMRSDNAPEAKSVEERGNGGS